MNLSKLAAKCKISFFEKHKIAFIYFVFNFVANAAFYFTILIFIFQLINIEEELGPNQLMYCQNLMSNRS